MQAGDIIAEQFRLEQQIGSGGLGVVWRATQLNVDRPVAIKFLKSPTGATMRRFEVEAKALARLQHPGCVTLHEFGRTDGNVPYIVMEYLEGVTLGSLRGTRREISEVVDILEQLFRVLNYVHSRGLAHRDLKPENVLVDARGQLKVLDFGLAKVAELDAVSLTDTGEVFGTPIYMSPEQLRGSKDAGAPADIYAVGVMAFELLTGKPPYGGDTMLDLAMGHLGDIPPEIERPDCPIELKQLVADMLAKDPAHRPTAAKALALVNPNATQYTRPVEVGRLPLGALIAVVGAIAVAMLAIVWILANQGDEQPQPPQVRDEPIASTTTTPTALDREPDPRPVMATPCKVAKTGTQTLTTGLGDQWTYHVPDKSSGTPRPVIVVLQTDRVMPKQMFEGSGLAAQADEHGLLLLGPDAEVKSMSNAVAATFDALDELDRRACIDRERIYVIGHGSGGNAASALGCQPEIAAIVTASFLPDAGQPAWSCPDSRPIPALHIAPTDSQHVPITGVSPCRNGAAVPLDDHEAAWRERNACANATPKRTKHEDGSCSAWTECAAPFTGCRIDGGHDWPGVDSNDPFPDCAGTPSNFPSAEVAVDFLLPHRRRVAGCGKDFDGTSETTIVHTVDGRDRDLWVSLPADYDPNRPHPVLLAVADRRRHPSQYVARAKFGEPANDAGYIIIAPVRDGARNIGTVEPWRDAYDHLGDAVNRASEEFCVDPSRVYAMGHSDGASALQLLTCEQPFAGVVLTGMGEPDPPMTCQPLGPPPTLRMVGRHDKYVPILGGLGCEREEKRLNADEADKIWKQERNFGCRGRKIAWDPRPDECVTWSCETPYVSCRVKGGPFFQDSDLKNSIAHTKRDCREDEVTPFELNFEQTVLPFFAKHGRPIP